MDNTNNITAGKKAYIFAGLGVGLLIFGIFMTFQKPSFEIVDIYTDSTDNGKYIFLFVNTKSESKNDLLNWANDIKHGDNLLDMPDKTKPAMMTVFFFNPDDTSAVDDVTSKKLKERYPESLDLSEKINFTSKGWQYIGHNDPNITEVPRDTVYQTYVFIPKTGYRAYDIINIINK